MKNPSADGPIYVLGHSEDELRRLTAQANFFGELTAGIFSKAGIGRGLRVLDLGCGAGDVTFLVAELVGPAGNVIGIDKSGQAIETARARAAAIGLTNVAFMQRELAEISLDEPVDAIVGRFILLYASDPAALLRRVAIHLRPGGVVAFQEMDMTGVRSFPRAPLFEENRQRVVETFRRGGVDTEMGLRLHSTFVGAGLPAPEMLMGARVESGSRPDGFEVFTQTVRSLLPRMEEFGIATAAEVGVETLAQRLQDEVAALGGVIVLPNLVGAWVRKPD